MTNTTCTCGKAKAERAAKCFDCLHAEYTPKAHVARKVGGEAGKTWRAYRANGQTMSFAHNQHDAAVEWAND